MRSDNISRAPFNTVTSLHLKLADDAQVREFSDKDSVYSVGSISRNRRANKIKNPSMKSIKGITKNKNKNMDYTNYAYNEAVGRLKFMLAESYTTPKTNYLKSSIYEDHTDNFSDSVSAIDRPVLSDISKYLSPNQKARLGVYRPKKLFPTFSASKENLVAEPAQTQTYTAGSSVDYYSTARTLPPPAPVTSGMPAPVEIFDFIEKQEDYIQQLEKESKFCRNELSNLLEKVKDVINENEALTETARSELAALTGYEGDKKRVVVTTTTSSESEDIQAKKSPIRKKDTLRSPRYANAPKIVYEARISELEAELMQSNIDLKRLKQENAELQRKLALADPVTTLTATTSCEAHRKQIEQLQLEKSRLEDSLRHSQKALDEAKAEQMSGLSSKRYVNDLMQMERSQAELEVKHLRDELDRQHERVRELQHEMARRIADERSNAERRYNNQVDQLGGDLSNQWEQVAKLQMELERQKRYESDMKRDLSSRNAQVEDLKQELRANRSAMLADMAQINAEKQSLEQEITSLRLQLDRAAREHKTEAARLNAEISSLRQRLDRGDADLLHSKREVLRLNDEIANLEKELAYGELKNEVRPTKKDLDQRISEMQTKHAETVNELEDMIQSQRQLMDKLTQECKTLTKNLEETTIKHNIDCQALRDVNEQLLKRLKEIWMSYKKLEKIRSSSSTSTSTSCNEEEHFLENTQTDTTTQKPLSTTSRPHLAQPKPVVLCSMTMPMQKPRRPTAMKPSVENPQIPLIPMCPPQQLQRPHQQPNMNIQMAATTTKTSKTLARERNKEKHNHLRRQQYPMKATPSTQHWNLKLNTTPTWPQQTTQQPTMPAMRVTSTNNNTIPTPMVESMMEQSNMMTHKSMMQMPNSQQPITTKTTQPIQLSMRPQQAATSTTHQAQQLNQSPPSSQQQNKPTVAQPIQHHPAEVNRARAVAIWGQQVQEAQSAQENPLCHNSLPRPPPKSSITDFLDPLMLTYDPIDINVDVTISSPSLLRSFDSSNTYTIESACFDSLSEMSVSPPRTAIRIYETTDTIQHDSTTQSIEEVE